jgi:hypothetical protein
MVGVFSKLRAALFDATRMRGYVVYAAGEVILIVLGILIAIQLDTAQQLRQERRLEQAYIENLLEDVRFDITRSEVWFSRFDGKVNGLLLAKDFYFGDEEPEDLSEFLSAVGKGGSGSRGAVLAITATYAELISTGNLRYIRDNAVKNEILDYHTYKDFIEQYMSNLRSEYAPYTNSGRPYSPRGGLAEDTRDVPVALARFKRPEFLELVNQELTYAYSADSVMRVHRDQAEDMVVKLESYLATF